MAETEGKILLVDDDVELTTLMAEFFSSQGFALRMAHNGPQGLSEALTGSYALVLLDVMMPGFDGFELLNRLRQQSQIPVIMLTARSESRSRIQGLNTGADDYLPKPFDPMELLARVRAVLRRSGGGVADPSQPLEISGVRLDPGGRHVQCGGVEIDVTTIEFDILETLMRAAGRVVSRDDLTMRLYGRESSPFDRSIDVHVSHLRKKLVCGERIRTIRGQGYQFVSGASEAQEA